jgi:hypothetical protein
MFGTQCTPPSLSPLFAKVLMYFIQRFHCKLLVHDVMTAIVRERERERERLKDKGSIHQLPLKFVMPSIMFSECKLSR